jgi:hypothetical protein
MRLVRPVLTILLAAAAAPASAEFHLMSIREVYVGPADNANAQYVVLQMYASGQNLVMGHDVTFYDAAGDSLGTVTFASNVPNGANQDYILIATSEAEAKFGIDADLAMTPLLAPAGGKVCFEDIDCFSWGTYAGSATTPSPSGTPFNAAGGLTADSAARRDISGGTSASQLDAGDDTDDSAADFDFAAAPNPQNNGPAEDDECTTYGCNAGGGSGGGGYGGGGALPSLASLMLLLAWRARRRGGPIERP